MNLLTASSALCASKIICLVSGPHVPVLRTEHLPMLSSSSSSYTVSTVRLSSDDTFSRIWHVSSTMLAAEQKPIISTFLSLALVLVFRHLPQIWGILKNWIMLHVILLYLQRINTSLKLTAPLQTYVKAIWTVTYTQDKSLQDRRNILKWNQRQIIIGWRKAPRTTTKINLQVLEMEEFISYKWMVKPLLRDISNRLINDAGLYMSYH